MRTIKHMVFAYLGWLGWQPLESRKVVEVEASKTRREWDKLPKDMLQLIIERLDVVDRIRFRLVCKAWRTYTNLKQTPTAIQLPWLLLPPKYKCDHLTLFDSCASRIYRLKLPKSAQAGKLVAASNGWLLQIITNKSHIIKLLFLFDPISRTRIPLPPPSKILSEHDLSQVAVSSPDASQCIVALSFGNDIAASFLAICVPQSDESWTIFEVEGAKLKHMLFTTTTTTDDDGALTLYVLNESHVIDESEEVTFKTHTITLLGGGRGHELLLKLKLKLKIIPCIMPRGPLIVDAEVVYDNGDDEQSVIRIYKGRCIQCYLVESKLGGVLLVNRISDVITGGGEEDGHKDDYLLCYTRLNRFEVLQIQTTETAFTTKRLNSLDNQTLFVGGGDCLSIHPSQQVFVTSNKVVDSDNDHKTDCIYFLDGCGIGDYPDPFSRESGIFYLKDRSIKRLFPSLKSEDEVFMAWFSPNITIA